MYTFHLMGQLSFVWYSVYIVKDDEVTDSSKQSLKRYSLTGPEMTWCIVAIIYLHRHLDMFQKRQLDLFYKYKRNLIIRNKLTSVI